MSNLFPILDSDSNEVMIIPGAEKTVNEVEADSKLTTSFKEPEKYMSKKKKKKMEKYIVMPS